jgi:hypothetical protein
MTTNYVYGDAKTYDAANFGLFKQNWGMLRVCATRYGLAGQSEAQWNNGAVLKYETPCHSLALRSRKDPPV